MAGGRLRSTVLPVYSPLFHHRELRRKQPWAFWCSRSAQLSPRECGPCTHGPDGGPPVQPTPRATCPSSHTAVPNHCTIWPTMPSTRDGSCSGEKTFYANEKCLDTAWRFVPISRATSLAMRCRLRTTDDHLEQLIGTNSATAGHAATAAPTGPCPRPCATFAAMPRPSSSDISEHVDELLAGGVGE
jgi:hypothetical protein